MGIDLEEPLDFFPRGCAILRKIFCKDPAASRIKIGYSEESFFQEL
jgi:hypothetical protein